jgi:hypothetical protein
MKLQAACLVVSVITCSFLNADNVEIESGKAEVDVEILKVVENINSLVDEAANKATSSVNTIVIDKDELESFFNGVVSSQMWGAETLKQKFAEFLATVTAKIAEDVKSKVPGAITEFKKAIQTEIANKTPNAHFSAYWAHPKGQRAQNNWSGGDAAKKGLTGANGSLTVEVGFSGGVAAGVNATCEVKASFSRSVDYSITSFSSVDPKSGSGETITIKATPNYDRKDTVGVVVKAFIGITVTAGSTDSGQLDEVKGTLTCG